MQKNAKKNTKNNDIIEVAVIGAGPGGLYTAMRMLEEKDKEDKPLYLPNSVKVFECSDDIGGRVKTLPIGKIPYTADIGAMRFIENKQVIISNLINNKFNLNIESIDFEGDTNAYFLRDRVILPETTPGKKIGMIAYDGEKRVIKDQDAYNLVGVENYLNPTELITYAIYNCIAKIDLAEHGLMYAQEVRINTRNKRDIIRSYMHLSKMQDLKEEAIRLKKFFNDPETVQKGFDFFKLEEWQYIQNYGAVYDKYLYEIGLRYILDMELSPEGVELAVSALGYHHIFSQTNAADFIPWYLIEFGKTKYKTIRKGMKELIFELKKAIDKCIPDGIQWLYKGHKLNDITKKSDHYLLRFSIFRNNVQEFIFFKAKNIVLSISKGALERINFPVEAKLNPHLRHHSNNKNNLKEVLNCVNVYPLVKTFLFYARPWFWDHFPVDIKNIILKKKDKHAEIEKNESIKNKHKFSVTESGDFKVSRVITNMPISQIYYHGIEGHWRHENGVDCKVCNAMIMSYGDTTTALMMKDLTGTSSNEHYVDSAFKNAMDLSAPEYDLLLRNFGPPSELGEMLHNNLLNVFVKSFAPNQDILREIKLRNKPLAVFIKDWNDEPFYGGWHGWRAGIRPWHIRQSIQKPYDEENIFIVGEVFSADQGWIEGALRTSERNLRINFNFDKREKPDWLGFENLKTMNWCIKQEDDNIRNFENYLDW